MILLLKKKYLSSLKIAELALFPSFCQLCSSMLESPGENVVCRACLESLRPRLSSFCSCCGRFFNDSGEPHLCLKCLQDKPPFSRHRSCGLYQGKLKDIILLYKYRKYRILGKDLASFIYRNFGKQEDIWWGVEAIIPVPLHPKRKMQRGFNQAEIIAKELARLKGIKFIKGRLLKKKNAPPQTSLKAQDRQHNVRGAFGVIKSDEIKKKVVLLVDDVYTTGATIRECSLVLRKAGVKEVRALTVVQA